MTVCLRSAAGIRITAGARCRVCCSRAGHPILREASLEQAATLCLEIHSLTAEVIERFGVTGRLFRSHDAEVIERFEVAGRSHDVVAALVLLREKSK